MLTHDNEITPPLINTLTGPKGARITGHPLDTLSGPKGGWIRGNPLY